MKNTNNRVHWDTIEVAVLAKKWVQLRIQYPFAPILVLLQQAQEAIFEADNRRPITSLSYVKGLEDAIMAEWKKGVSAEQPAPQIIEVAVEKPIDYVDLANRLDLETSITIAIKNILREFRSNGAAHDTTATARSAAQPISMLVAASKAAIEEKKRPPCVLVCTVDGRLFSEAKAEVEKYKIPVELRWLDLDTSKPNVPLRTEYVIFSHGMNHTTPVSQTILASVKRSNIRVVPPHTGTLLQAVMKEIRDISSLQRPLAK